MSANIILLNWSSTKHSFLLASFFFVFLFPEVSLNNIQNVLLKSHFWWMCFLFFHSIFEMGLMRPLLTLIFNLPHSPIQILLFFPPSFHQHSRTQLRINNTAFLDLTSYIMFCWYFLLYSRARCQYSAVFKCNLFFVFIHFVAQFFRVKYNHHKTTTKNWITNWNVVLNFGPWIHEWINLQGWVAGCRICSNGITLSPWSWFLVFLNQIIFLEIIPWRLSNMALRFYCDLIPFLQFRKQE